MMKPNGSFALEGNASLKASMYNDSIYKALALGAEWMFLMDVDQVFPVNTIPKLFDTAEKHGAKIVSVLYHLGKPPYGPVAGWFKDLPENKVGYVNAEGNGWNLNYAPLGKGVVEVDWVGSGGLLVHRDVIDKIQWPPFVDTWTPGRGTRDTGHDINFCLRAKEKGFKIYVDTDVQSDHGKFTYIGKLWADGFNESKMLESMDGILHRNSQESGYWDTVWQIEDIKKANRGLSYKDTLNDLEALVPAGAKVADLGCGLGAVMEHLRDKRKCECTGYDFSEQAIQVVQSKGFSGKIADLRNFVANGDSGQFDVVVTTHTIEHLHDDHALIKGAKSLCKPGGKVIIATPWREEIQGHFEHVHAYSDQDMNALMAKHFLQYEVKKNNRDYVATGVVS